MREILKKARQEFPKGTLFLSASGNLKFPMKVSSLQISEVYKDTIVNSEGGIIYDDGIWAKKV